MADAAMELKCQDPATLAVHISRLIMLLTIGYIKSGGFDSARDLVSLVRETCDLMTQKINEATRGGK